MSCNIVDNNQTQENEGNGTTVQGDRLDDSIIQVRSCCSSSCWQQQLKKSFNCRKALLKQLWEWDERNNTPMIKEQGKPFVILPYHHQLGKFNKGNTLIVLCFLKFQPHASPSFRPFSALRSQSGLKCVGWVGEIFTNLRWMSGFYKHVQTVYHMSLCVVWEKMCPDHFLITKTLRSRGMNQATQ